MSEELREKTVSARVTRRVRALIDAAAEASGATASRVAAEGAEEQARRILLGKRNAEHSSESD